MIHRFQRGIGMISVIVTIFVVGAVTVLGGSYIATKTGKGGPLLDLGRQIGFETSPQADIESAMKKTMKQTSADIDGTIHFTGTQTGDPEISGPVDMTIGVQLKAASISQTDSEEEENEPTEGMFTLAGTQAGQEMDLTVDYRIIPPRTYFKLSGTGQVEGMALEQIAAGFFDTWYFFDRTEGSPIDQMLSLPTAPSGEDCENPEALEAYFENLDLNRVVNGIEHTGTERMDETVEVYRIEPNSEGILEVLQEANEVGACDEAFEQPEDLSVSEVTIMIGESSGLMRGVAFTADTKTETLDGEMTVDVRLSNFNESPSVEAPEDAASLNDLFGGFLGGFELPDMDEMESGQGDNGGDFPEVPDNASDLLDSPAFQGF